MSFPKNIFFYWDGPDVSEAVIENVNNYRKLNPSFKVILANDTDIIRYSSVYPTLINLFQKATIAALKSDIARLVLLNEEGGAWIDSNTTLEANDAMPEIFNGCDKFKIAFTVLPNRNFDLRCGFMIARPQTELAGIIIESMTEKLSIHHHKEKASELYVPYNYFNWVAPVVAYEFLGYEFNEEFRNSMKNNYSSQKFINPNITEFQKYNCGLVDVSGFLRFHGTNMDHHHSSNFHKHWSNLQKTQKLFFN
jgi:hypothetical protein